MQEVILYDFEKDSWIQLEDTPKKIQWCTASSAHEKDYKQKVYVLSADDNFDSHWMIFDIATQHWTFFMNDLRFVFSCCYGNMLTLRNVHYYFHNGVPGSSGWIEP